MLFFFNSQNHTTIKFILFFLLLCGFNTTTDHNTMCVDIYKLIRCLDCSGQNIHDSNSAFAKNAKAEIISHINNGLSKPEIIQIMVNKYGESIYIKPSVNHTLLWISPFVILIISITITAYISKFSRKRS